MKSFILLILCFLPFLAVAQTNMPSREEIENDRDYLELQGQLKSVDNEMNALMADYEKLTVDQRNNSAHIQSLNDRYDGIQAKKSATLKSFITGHPDSFISLIILTQSEFDANEADALYNSLSEKVKSTDLGMALGENIRLTKITAIGSTAPDFTQNNAAGKPVRLSDFKGKYVLIDFWASWCGPCRQENPNVVKAYSAFKDKNFTILGVSLDQSKTAWLNAIQNDGLAWTQVSDLKGWHNAVAGLFNIKSIPQNFLVDPNGVIIRKNLRGPELQQALSEIIK